MPLPTNPEWIVEPSDRMWPGEVSLRHVGAYGSHKLYLDEHDMRDIVKVLTAKLDAIAFERNQTA